MLCSGSLSVLLELIIGRSVVVLLKFLILVFLFRFLCGMRVFACLLLEDNVCSISLVISLLLVSLYVKLDIVG